VAEAVAIAELNTAPELWSDGLTLAFAREVDMDNVDLFVSTRASVDGAWTVPVLIEELNAPEREWGAHSHDGLEVLFCSDRFEGQRQLLRSTRASTGASFDAPQQILAFATRDACEPWYDPERGLLVMAGGPELGWDNIYFSEFDGSGFSTPAEMPTIGTTEDETAPWLHFDDETNGSLYFGRAPGDLYVAEFTLSVE
jgi:hypothetical protein